MLLQFWNDEAGFLVAAELVLVSTILILGMIVGLSEVSVAINEELEDLSYAFGAVNQSHRYDGLDSDQHGRFGGGRFRDRGDDFRGGWDIVCAGGRGENG